MFRLSSRFTAPLAGVALVAASVALAPVVPAVAATAPAGLAPRDTTVTTPTPALSWKRATGASRYELQVDDDPAFGSPVIASTSNRRWVPATPLAPGLEHWRIRSVASNGTVSGWATARFTVGQPSGPAVLAPAHGAVLEPPEPAVLQWTPVPGAVGYTVQVADDPAMTSPITYSTQSTAVVSGQIVPGVRYSWRVRAELGNGNSTSFTPVSDYQVGALPPVENAFPDSTEPVHDVVLSWDPVPGAVSYHLWVSRDPAFSDPEADVLVNTTKVYGTRYSPPTTWRDGDYFWKVRGVNSAGEARDWNQVAVHVLRRAWTDVPELLHPAPEGTAAAPLHLQWTPVPRATYYELNVGTDPGFTAPAQYGVCTTASTTYTPGSLSSDRCLPDDAGTYYWRVRAVDSPAGVFGDYSAVGSFGYDPATPAQQAPADGAEVAVPTLRWADADGAERYRVVVTGSGGYRVSTETYSTSWTPNLDPARGPFTWTVQARRANLSYSPLQTGRAFSIAGTPAAGAEVPLTPLTGTSLDPPTTRFPALAWEPWPEADHYRVEIGPAGTDDWDAPETDPILETEFDYPAATSTGDHYLAAGSYRWRVTAYDSGDEPLGTGPVAVFTVADLPEVEGRRIALAGNGLDMDSACAVTACDDVPATPVLDWQPVPGAGLYKILLARDPDLTDLVYGSAGSVPRTVNTRWTPDRSHHSPSQLPDGSYFWFVLPCKTVTHCNPDPTGTAGAATNSFTKRSPSPVLLTPADGSVERSGGVSFTWQDYLETNLGTTWPATGETPGQEAKRYRIQVATDPGFETLVDSSNLQVDQTTYTPYSRTYPEGTLYWRVQAVDAADNALPWSATSTVLKRSPTPALLSPAGGSATDGRAPFEWSPTPYAASYRLQVYRNDEVQPGNLVFSRTVAQTAYAHSTPLPVSALAYRWTVTRVDAHGRAGDPSEQRRFFVSGTAPVRLGSPAQGARIRADDSYFTWYPVAGAQRYHFEYRPASKLTSSRVSTVATAYAHTHVFSTGTWQWRVHALGPGGTTLSVSPWRSFVADGRRPAVKSFRPAARSVVRPAVNVRIRFTEPVSGVRRATVKLIRTGTGKQVRAKLKLSADKRSVIVDPRRSLARGKTYTVRVTAGVRDRVGLPLVPKSWRIRVSR